MPRYPHTQVARHLKQKLHAAARRERADDAETRYANLNWEHCRTVLFDYLHAVASELNAIEPQGLYKFIVSAPPGDPATRQAVLRATRREHVPTASVAYPRTVDAAPWETPPIPSKLHEAEKPCELIFSATNTGHVVVFLLPHGSSNAEPHHDHFVLRGYSCAGDITVMANRRALDSAVRSFIRLHAISCYGAVHHRFDRGFLRNLAVRNRKWRRRFESDAEQEREQYRVEWALGVGAVSGLFVALAQTAAAAFFEEKSPLPAFFLGIIAILFSIRVWFYTRR